jgi:hypothetical protein
MTDGACHVAEQVLFQNLTLICNRLLMIFKFRQMRVNRFMLRRLVVYLLKTPVKRLLILSRVLRDWFISWS